MPTRSKTANHGKTAKTPDRRAGTQAMVQKLVAERTEMLSLYWRLAGMDSLGGGHEIDRKTKQKQLPGFCQVLVDYIAAGHFSLYERIVSGTERRLQVREIAEKLYPRISETTQHALDFNDRYDCGDHCQITEKFDQDLSRLGEELTARIELEDQLISAMTQ
jgi:regulator of sigma D